MNAMTDMDEMAISDQELIVGLEQALHDSLHRKQAVRRLVRRSSSYQSSHPLEELTVLWERGEWLDLIFKNVSPRALLSTARRAKPAFLDDPRREISVYQTILAAADMGTPRYYGSLMDSDLNRCWLFLERVRGQELYQIGQIELWLSAARWLARLHGRFAYHEELRNAPFLTRLDRQYYQRWFDRAVRFAHASGVDSSRRATIERLASLAPRILDDLLDLPTTLIHGEFYASNVLIDEACTPIRVCPLDWERTAVGPGFIDLAALVAGTWPEEAKRQMALAYHQELGRIGSPAPSFDVVLRGLDLCRLQLAVQWLGWSSNWTPPNEHRHDWFGEALCVAGKLGLMR
jgi:hypothetical protein